MFAIIALAGISLLVFSILFDGVLDAALPDFGWFSLPAIGAALAAFGVTAWVLENQADVPIGAATGVAALLALSSGALAYRMSRAAMGMATDATPASDDLLGTSGRVVTPIADSSTGEVLVRFAGQSVKLTASTTDGRPLRTGVDVVVVAVASSTRVTVEEAGSFWSDGG